MYIFKINNTLSKLATKRGLDFQSTMYKNNRRNAYRYEKKNFEERMLRNEIFFVLIFTIPCPGVS